MENQLKHYLQIQQIKIINEIETIKILKTNVKCLAKTNKNE